MQKNLKQLERYIKVKVVQENKKNPYAVTVIYEKDIEKLGFTYGDLILVAARLEEAYFLKRVDSDGDLEARCVQVIYRRK